MSFDASSEAFGGGDFALAVEGGDVRRKEEVACMWYCSFWLLDTFVFALFRDLDFLLFRDVSGYWDSRYTNQVR